MQLGEIDSVSWTVVYSQFMQSVFQVFATSQVSGAESIDTGVNDCLGFVIRNTAYPVIKWFLAVGSLIHDKISWRDSCGHYSLRASGVKADIHGFGSLPPCGSGSQNVESKG